MIFIPKTQISQRASDCVPRQCVGQLSLSAPCVVKSGCSASIDRGGIDDAALDFCSDDYMILKWIMVVLNQTTHSGIVNLYPSDRRLNYLDIHAARILNKFGQGP